jgi:hypothetical protein
VAPGLDRILRRCLNKEPARRFQVAHDLALAPEGIAQAPVGASLGEAEERSPYPGLACFTERDAGVFFGRDADVKALWQRLQGRKLLAVIGPSGSGKRRRWPRPVPTDPPLLYQLEEDPAERFDVAARHTEALQRIIRRVEAHRATVQPVPDQLAIPLAP